MAARWRVRHLAIMAGGGVPCPEGQPLKAADLSLRQVSTPRLAGLLPATAVESQNLRGYPMTKQAKRRAVKFGAEIIPFVSRPTCTGNAVASIAEVKRAYENFPPECKAFLVGLALDHARNQADQIFPAIELCRMLFTVWDGITKSEPDTDAPERAAWDKQNSKACLAYNKAIKQLIETPPTTAAGAAALIAFCLDDKALLFGTDDRQSDCNYSRALLRTLAKALPAIV